MNKNLNSNRDLISTVMVTIGLLCIMLAAFLPLVRLGGGYNPYIYASGALLLLIGRFIAPKVENASLRLRRLLRMEIWTALIFVVGAVFLFLPQARTNDWLAFTMAGAALTVYTSIMIPRTKK